MKLTRTIMQGLLLFLLWVAFGVILYRDSVKPAEARATFEQRQTRALEKIASELEKSRRCQCK